MNPHWKIFCRNETAYWNEGFLSDCGIHKVWGLYLFDANHPVHCCELTPSYELWPLDSSFVMDSTINNVSDRVWERIAEADQGDREVTYYHCNILDQAMPDRILDLGEENLDGATLDEAREEMLAVLAGNPRYPNAVLHSW